MHIQSYLFFEGRADEAFEFYRRALGAEVISLMRYKESPDPPSSEMGLPPNSGDKVMHACLQIGKTQVMASDGMCSGTPKFEGSALVLNVQDAAETDRAFNALSDGGNIQMPLAETFFSPRFGMVADRFGVSWMVIARSPEC